MIRRLLAILTLLLPATPTMLAAQSGMSGSNISVTGAITPGDCVSFASSSQFQDAGSPCGTGSGNVTTSGVITTGQIAVWATATAIKSVAISGDSTMTSAGVMTNTGLNNTSLSGLATGLLKNTTGTGVPSIAVGGTDYLRPADVTGSVIANAGYCADTSITANTITCAPTNPITSYQAGLQVLVKVANTNTGATTIAISGLAAKNVTEGGGNAQALNGGELVTTGSGLYILQYDGTQFQIQDSATVDCAAAAGATLDAKIAAALAASTTSKAVVIDCRNVNGTPQISANPFASLTEASYTASTGGYVLMPLQQVNINHTIAIPSGWQVIGNAAQFASGSNGTYLKAGASLKPKYTTGTVNSTSCSAGPPITCTITGNAGTNWVSGAGVVTDMHFTLCATGGGNSGTLCTTSAANAVDGRITAIGSDTSITIDSVTQSTSNGAGTYNYVIWSPMVEMGTEAASAPQPASFGVLIGGLKIDANGVSGAVPVYNRSCQNGCGFNGFIYVNPADSGGFVLMGSQMQNSGPWYPFWSVCQVGKCAATTIGAIIRGGTSVPIGLQGWSVAADAVAGATPIGIDSPAFLIDAHVLAGGSADGVAMGTNITCLICDIPGLSISGGGVFNLNAAAGGTGSALHIGSNLSPKNFLVIGAKAPASAGWTNTFKDDNRGCTLANSAETTLGFYVVGNTTGTYNSTSEGPGCAGFGLAGTAPANVPGAGTAGTSNFAVTNMTGGGTTGSATTAGTGASGTLQLGGTGGSGAGGTNAIGGAGGNATFSAGGGGASGGTAVNSNGGNVNVNPGAAGTGGSGTAGQPGGVVITQPTNANATNVAAFTVNGTFNNASINGPLVNFSATNTASNATATILQLMSGASGTTVEWQGDRGGNTQQQGNIRGISSSLHGWNSGGLNTAVDTNLSRTVAGLVSFGTTAANASAYTKSAQTIAVTAADVTCGTGGTLTPCTSFTTITGLSATLPLSAQTWAFECDLIVSQATAAAADQIGIQTATNGATNMTAMAIASPSSSTISNGAITDVASTTTAQSVITFTPGATGTKVPIHMGGTLEGVSASGTVFNVVALTGAAADLMTIYRGSECWIH